MSDVEALPTARTFSDVVRAERLTETSATYSSLRLAGFLGGWVAMFLIARILDDPVSWVAAWVVQAFVFEGCNIGTHESAHNNLYRRKPLDYLAGMAWAVPVLYSYAAYRTSHLEHHKNTHDPERDSEPVYERTTLVDYLGYMALSGIAYTFILLLEGAEAALGKGKAWMRTGRRRWLAALSTFVVLAELGLVAYGLDEAPMLTLELWGAPFLLYATFLAPMVSHPEHTDCAFGPSSPLLTTRTTLSNRVVRFFIWNVNLHTAHHLLPSVPGQKLTKLQPHVEPYCAHTVRSYSAWHLGYLRGLVGRGPALAPCRPEGVHEAS